MGGHLSEILDIGMFVVACVVLLAGFPGGGDRLHACRRGAGLRGQSAGRWGVFDLSFVRFIPQRIFGTMTNEVLIAVPLFVFMGVMLERSKVAEELLEKHGPPVRYAARRARHLRLGGRRPARGLDPASSAPRSSRWGCCRCRPCYGNGYDTKLACGSICAAGTLGQIIPPSIVLVILGDQISNSYQQVQLEMQQKAWGEGDYSFSPDTVSVGRPVRRGADPRADAGRDVHPLPGHRRDRPAGQFAAAAGRRGQRAGMTTLLEARSTSPILKVLLPPVILNSSRPRARSWPASPRRPKRPASARSAPCCWPG